MDDKTRREVLGEVLMDELRAIHELVFNVPSIKNRVEKIETHLGTIESDVSVIKLVVTDHSKQIAEIRKKAS